MFLSPSRCSGFLALVSLSLLLFNFACIKLMAAGGYILSWGNPYYQVVEPPETLTNIVAISSGGSRNLALREGGTVAAWGKNADQDIDPAADHSSQLTNIIGISAGSRHSVALRSDGTVVAWGLDDFGQTAVPPSLTNVVSVVAGYSHSVALQEDGTVVEWPIYRSGLNVNVPAGLDGVIAVGAGKDYSAALKADGSVVVWGFNDHGQQMVPFAATNIVSLAVGFTACLALREDGEMIYWGGDNHSRAWQNPFSPPGIYEIGFAGTGWLNLMQDGRVLEWPWLFTDGRWVRLDARLQAHGAVAISGHLYGTALIGAGEPRFVERYARRSAIAGLTPVHLVANPVGQTPMTYQWQKDGIDVQGATERRLKLTAPGMEAAGVYRLRAANVLGSALSEPILVEVVPSRITRQPRSQSVVRGATAVFTFEQQSIGGQVQWLFNGQELPGETNTFLELFDVGPGHVGTYSVRFSNVHGVVESEPAALAVTQIAAWGHNEYGQTDVPLDLDDVVAVETGEFFSFALLADGTIRAWGTNHFGPLHAPANATNIVTMATAFRHTLAVSADGNVLAWGADDYGQLYVPGDLSNVVQVSATHARSLALKSDGTVVQWGGIYVDPVLTSLSNVVSISNGADFWLALKSDGTLVAGGNSDPGRTNLWPGLTNIVAIDAGGAHSLALKADGTVHAFGIEVAGSTHVPSGLSNVIAVSAGSHFSTVLKSDGTVVAWGSTEFGQANAPPGLDGVTAIASGPFHSLALAREGPPVLQPVVTRRNVLAGTFAHLSVPAVGTWPLHHQWRRDGVDLAGETNAFFVLHDPHPTNSGNYTVRVWNEDGEVISPEIHLEVPIAQFLRPITNTATYQDGPARFEAVLEGRDLSFSWLFNGEVIAGETNSTLSLTNVQPANAGRYTLVISNSYGTLEADAQLTVLPVLITKQSLMQKVLVRNPAQFSVVAEGVGLQYQWRFNGQDLPNETNATLTIAEPNWPDAGVYTVRVRSNYGEAISGPANLELSSILGSFGIHASSNLVTFSTGTSHGLLLLDDGSVIGFGNNTYGKAVPPATLSNIVAVAAGGHHSLALRDDGKVFAWGGSPQNKSTVMVPALLDNVIAIAVSSVESFAVRADGSVVSWGSRSLPPPMHNALAVASGGQGTLALRSDGTVTAWPNNQFQFRRLEQLSNIVSIAMGYNSGYALREDGKAYYLDLAGPRLISGATNIVAMSAHLLLRSKTSVMSFGGFNPVTQATNVINLGRGIYSEIMYTVQAGDPIPRILPEIKERYGVVGGDVLFTPGVIGKHPFTYEWLRNGEIVPNESKRWLRLTNLTAAAGGAYQLRVRNSAGETISAEMRLTIREPEPMNLAIESQPLRLLLRAEGTVGGQMLLESSSNLQNWSLNRRITNVTASTFHAIPGEQLAPSRLFFRLSEPTP